MQSCSMMGQEQHKLHTKFTSSYRKRGRLSRKYRNYHHKFWHKRRKISKDVEELYIEKLQSFQNALHSHMGSIRQLRLHHVALETNYSSLLTSENIACRHLNLLQTRTKQHAEQLRLTKIWKQFVLLRETMRRAYQLVTYANEYIRHVLDNQDYLSLMRVIIIGLLHANGGTLARTELQTQVVKLCATIHVFEYRQNLINTLFNHVLASSASQLRCMGDGRVFAFLARDNHIRQQCYMFVQGLEFSIKLKSARQSSHLALSEPMITDMKLFELAATLDDFYSRHVPILFSLESETYHLQRKLIDPMQSQSENESSVTDTMEIDDMFSVFDSLKDDDPSRFRLSSDHQELANEQIDDFVQSYTSHMKPDPPKIFQFRNSCLRSIRVYCLHPHFALADENDCLSSTSFDLYQEDNFMHLQRDDDFDHMLDQAMSLIPFDTVDQEESSKGKESDSVIIENAISQISDQYENDVNKISDASAHSPPMSSSPSSSTTLDHNDSASTENATEITSLQTFDSIEWVMFLSTREQTRLTNLLHAPLEELSDTDRRNLVCLWKVARIRQYYDSVPEEWVDLLDNIHFKTQDYNEPVDTVESAGAEWMHDVWSTMAQWSASSHNRANTGLHTISEDYSIFIHSHTSAAKWILGMNQLLHSMHNTSMEMETMNDLCTTVHDMPQCNCTLCLLSKTYHPLSSNLTPIIPRHSTSTSVLQNEEENIDFLGFKDLQEDYSLFQESATLALNDHPQINEWILLLQMIPSKESQHTIRLDSSYMFINQLLDHLSDGFHWSTCAVGLHQSSAHRVAQLLDLSYLPSESLNEISPNLDTIWLAYRKNIIAKLYPKQLMTSYQTMPIGLQQSLSTLHTTDLWPYHDIIASSLMFRNQILNDSNKSIRNQADELAVSCDSFARLVSFLDVVHVIQPTLKDIEYVCQRFAASMLTQHTDENCSMHYFRSWQAVHFICHFVQYLSIYHEIDWCLDVLSNILRHKGVSGDERVYPLHPDVLAHIAQWWIFGIIRKTMPQDEYFRTSGSLVLAPFLWRIEHNEIPSETCIALEPMMRHTLCETTLFSYNNGNRLNVAAVGYTGYKDATRAQDSSTNTLCHPEPNIAILAQFMMQRAIDSNDPNWGLSNPSIRNQFLQLIHTHSDILPVFLCWYKRFGHHIFADDMSHPFDACLESASSWLCIGSIVHQCRLDHWKNDGRNDWRHMSLIRLLRILNTPHSNSSLNLLADQVLQSWFQVDQHEYSIEPADVILSLRILLEYAEDTKAVDSKRNDRNGKKTDTTCTTHLSIRDIRSKALRAISACKVRLSRLNADRLLCTSVLIRAESQIQFDKLSYGISELFFIYFEICANSFIPNAHLPSAQDEFLDVLVSSIKDMTGWSCACQAMPFFERMVSNSDTFVYKHAYLYRMLGWWNCRSPLAKHISRESLFGGWFGLSPHFFQKLHSLVLALPISNDLRHKLMFRISNTTLTCAISSSGIVGSNSQTWQSTFPSAVDKTMIPVGYTIAPLPFEFSHLRLDTKIKLVGCPIGSDSSTNYTTQDRFLTLWLARKHPILTENDFNKLPNCHEPSIFSPLPLLTVARVPFLVFNLHMSAISSGQSLRLLLFGALKTQPYNFSLWIMYILAVAKEEPGAFQAALTEWHTACSFCPVPSAALSIMKTTIPKFIQTSILSGASNLLDAIRFGMMTNFNECISCVKIQNYTR